MGIALVYQLHRTSVDIAKGYRQLEKAATALSKGKADSGVEFYEQNEHLRTTERRVVALAQH